MAYRHKADPVRVTWSDEHGWGSVQSGATYDGMISSVPLFERSAGDRAELEALAESWRAEYRGAEARARALGSGFRRDAFDREFWGAMHVAYTLNPGDLVWTVNRHTSRSGMLRVLDVYVFRVNDQGEIDRLWLSRKVADALGWGFSEGPEGVKVNGCGMDMGFHLVHALAGTIAYKVPGIWGAKLQAARDAFAERRRAELARAEAPNDPDPDYPWLGAHELRNAGLGAGPNGYNLRHRWL